MDEDLAIIRQAGGSCQFKSAAWARVLEQLRQSGLRPTEFARRHGINTKGLFRWRAKLQSRAAVVAPDKAFAELQVSSACLSVEIHLGQARVLVPFDGDARRLCMILQAVREAASC
jgi:transposase-like protein